MTLNHDNDVPLQTKPPSSPSSFPLGSAWIRIEFLPDRSRISSVREINGKKGGRIREVTLRFVTAIIVPSRRQSILIGYERARVVGGGEGIDNLYFNDCDRDTSADDPRMDGSRGNRFFLIDVPLYFRVFESKRNRNHKTLTRKTKFQI